MPSGAEVAPKVWQHDLRIRSRTKQNQRPKTSATIVLDNRRRGCSPHPCQHRAASAGVLWGRLRTGMQLDQKHTYGVLGKICVPRATPSLLETDAANSQNDAPASHQVY